LIGLEVHVQLATKSKAFLRPRELLRRTELADRPSCSGCRARCRVHRAAVELALRLGIATASKIRAKSRFHAALLLPDQPKGYQISQFDEPLCEEGHLDLIIDGAVKRVKLQRIHLEEDAGKNLHVGAVSHVDLTARASHLSRS